MENDTSEIDGDDVSKETTGNTAWFEDYSYTSGLSERMRLLFLSKVPIMMITTDEEDRTLLRLKSIWTRINKSWFAEVDAKDSKVTEEDKKVGPLTQMTVYNSVLGPRSIEEAVSGMQMRPLLEIKPADITEQLTLAYQWVPPKFSAKLRHLPTPRHYFVFQDSDAWMSGQSTDHIRRFLVEFAYQTRQNPNNSKTIILLSRTGYIHPSLSRYIEMVNDVTASDEELTRMLEGFKKRPVLSRNKIEFEPDTIQSLRGLTHYESKSALDHATVLAANRGQTTTIEDPKTGEAREAPLCQVRSSDILDFKRNQLRQSNLLTFIESDDSFDQLGGLGRFKEWAEEQKHTWTPEGRAYGLKPPRGVLNVGVWGCGKSHSVKALGRMWGLPVIQREIGKLRDSAVGGSEANVYQVTRMIDSMGPCILWADEAEKSFAGSASSGVTEGGILTRMIGILSTWIQESKSPFCFALTANSVRQLPVEFINRLTERFFFDLPTAEERTSVISILLKRAGQDPNRFTNLPALAAVSEGMVPREIEQAIEAANVKSFVAKKPCLDEALLKAELMSKPRITTTMTEELKELREWVGRDARSGDGIRARLASLPKAANGFQAL